MLKPLFPDEQDKQNDYGVGTVAMLKSTRVTVTAVTGNMRKVEWQGDNPETQWRSVHVSELMPVFAAPAEQPEEPPAATESEHAPETPTTICPRCMAGTLVDDNGVDRCTVCGYTHNVPNPLEKPEPAKLAETNPAYELKRKSEEIDQLKAALSAAKLESLRDQDKLLAQVADLRRQLQTALVKADQYDVLSDDLKAARAELRAMQNPRVEFKTLVQDIDNYAVAESDAELAKLVNCGWKIASENAMSQYSKENENTAFYRIVRLERPAQPEQPEARASVAAVLTADYVQDALEEDTDFDIEAVAQMADVNAMPDGVERDAILYHRRKDTLGARRAGAVTFGRRTFHYVDIDAENEQIEATMRSEFKTALERNMPVNRPLSYYAGQYPGAIPQFPGGAA